MNVDRLLYMAERQAERSTLRRFRTGAVLVDGKGNLVSKGCSNRMNALDRSVHAEEHCLSTLYMSDSSKDLTCVIVTLTRSGNWASSSRPCARCVHLLSKNGVSRVVYPERTNDGDFVINDESVESLVERSKNLSINETFAKRMYIA